MRCRARVPCQEMCRQRLFCYGPQGASRSMCAAAGRDGPVCWCVCTGQAVDTASHRFTAVVLRRRRVLYHGPVAEVQQHFQSLGFDLPPRMDVPSWLVEITTTSGINGIRKPASVSLF